MVAAATVVAMEAAMAIHQELAANLLGGKSIAFTRSTSAGAIATHRLQEPHSADPRPSLLWTPHTFQIGFFQTL